MTKNKPYAELEESQNPQVQDDSVMEYATSETISETLPPYTMEELYARIDEAEAEFEAGRGIPSTEVFASALAQEEQAKLQAKINAGIKDIQEGKGVCRKEGETTAQFFERICTE